MSCYNWERGEIKLPAKEFSKFRRKIIEAHNSDQDRIFDLAQKAHAAVANAAKGKRGFDKQEYFEDELRLFGDDDDTGWQDKFAVSDLIFPYIPLEGGINTSKRKFAAPKKKDLKKLPVSKDCCLSCGEASIAFDSKRKVVIWSVPENNHAVEDSRSHPVAKLFFRLLDQVNWTRGSGGKIIGNDEYNRDSDYEDGGGNYVTAEYPRKQQPRTSGLGNLLRW